MIFVLAGILLTLWLLGIMVFNVTAFAIHLLLLIAVLALVAHLLSGRRSSL